MYSLEIVQQRLGIAAKEIGFTPEYHSVAEIELFEQQLRQRHADAYAEAEADSKGSKDPTTSAQVSLMRSLSNPLNPRLSRDEANFIKNEAALCMSDAAYFLSRYYYIKTPQRIQRFTFLPGQKCYFNVISEIERRGMPVEMICNKSRQHGISTVTEGLILHRANFGYGVNCIVASADQTKTGKMAQMTFMGYDMLPWWIRAQSTRRVESDRGMLVFGGSRSGISFQHGSQASGIARGDTVKVYHLSEAASFSNPEEQIEASLFRCVHPHPDVFGIIESTAEGNSGWFHDTYMQAKKGWGSGRSRLCSMFLPWFVGTDKYPTPTWIATHPIPDGWRPAPDTRAMIAKANLYVQSDAVLRKVLGDNWTLPRNQAWYWEVHFMEHQAKNLQKLWYQEMPTDDRECFQGSYESVFGAENIDKCWSNRETAYWVYGVIGKSIEERHEPDIEEVDYSLGPDGKPAQPRIPLVYRSTRGETYRWELVPLKWMERFQTHDDLDDERRDEFMGKFMVWLQPEPGYDYSLGIDTSGGGGGDGSVISVCRLGRSPTEQDVQAAEWRDNRVGHTEVYAWAMAIASFYSKFMGEKPDLDPAQRIRWREPYVAVEQVAAVGDTVNVSMRAMGYSRFHRFARYDSVPKTVKRSKINKEGWFSFGWSREILTETFKTLVEYGWYKPNSPYTIWEMDKWEVHLTSKTGKDKFEHNIEATDDGIFAAAMSVFCPKDRKGLAERSSKRIVDNTTTRLPKLDFTPTVNGYAFSLTPIPEPHRLRRR